MASQAILKEFNEKCRKGQHPLKDVYTHDISDMISTVIRWCYVCGSIVVDTDVDGRRKPGDLIPMRRPKMLEASTQGE